MIKNIIEYYAGKDAINKKEELRLGIFSNILKNVVVNIDEENKYNVGSVDENGINISKKIFDEALNKEVSQNYKYENAIGILFIFYLIKFIEGKYDVIFTKDEKQKIVEEEIKNTMYVPNIKSMIENYNDFFENNKIIINENKEINKKNELNNVLFNSSSVNNSLNPLSKIGPKLVNPKDNEIMGLITLENFKNEYQNGQTSASKIMALNVLNKIGNDLLEKNDKKDFLIFFDTSNWIDYALVLNSIDFKNALRDLWSNVKKKFGDVPNDFREDFGNKVYLKSLNVGRNDIDFKNALISVVSEFDTLKTSSMVFRK